jgi:hypothetical protein
MLAVGVGGSLAGCGTSSSGSQPAGPSGAVIERNERNELANSLKQEESAETAKSRELLSELEAKNKEEAAVAKAKQTERAAVAKAKKKEHDAAVAAKKKEQAAAAKAKKKEATEKAEAQKKREEAAKHTSKEVNTQATQGVTLVPNEAG